MENNTENYSQYCFVVGATDVGKKRAANEDYLGKADTPNGRVVVVCDGMGGHVGGATASHMAVETILDFMRNSFRDDPREAIGEAIDAANRAILEHAGTHPELTGMGSTCVLLVVRNGKVYIGHVGDSRIYLVRSKTIRQLTVDHSYVQELVNAGAITKEQAEHHPRKNEITNALGIQGMKPATVRDEPISPEAGDVFLLCSDGLSNMVDDKHIAHIAGNLEMTTQQRANTLVQRANDNGGHDNITCALVEFSTKPELVTDVPFWKKKPFIIGAMAAAVVICGSVVWMVFNKAPEISGDNPEPTYTEDSTKVVKDTIAVLLKEQVDLGVVNVKANQQELLTIEFGSFFTLINDSNGKLLKRIDKFDGEFNSDGVRSDVAFLDLMVSSDKKRMELKLTKPAGEMKKGLTDPLHFSMQNETGQYEFGFTVKVIEDKQPVQTQTPPYSTTPTEKPKTDSIVEKVENVNDTIVVYVNKDGYRIVLCDKRGQDPADYWIIKAGHSFLERSADKGWYALECDGQKCIVIIKKKEDIPFNATIPIKVRSGVEGEVLLRIFKANS